MMSSHEGTPFCELIFLCKTNTQTNNKKRMKKNYESPQVEVVEIELEGVVCVSGNGSLESLSEGDSLGIRL